MYLLRCQLYEVMCVVSLWQVADIALRRTTRRIVLTLINSDWVTIA